MSKDPLMQLVADKKDITRLKPYIPKNTATPTKSQTQLEWMTERADYYKKRWLAAYRLLTPEQRHMASIEFPGVKKGQS